MTRDDFKPHSGEANSDLLRFLTCGSVDDGKSTLIGRLLHDTKLIFDDQLAALARESVRRGLNEDDLDLALLVDGLEAEREQGITIDVAYRFFSTPRRSFIVADTPGHEQYTRNMATGASKADLAIILVDARKGVLQQTRRHSLICSLLGIRHIILAANKIDLVNYDETIFKNITAEFSNFSRDLGFLTIQPIPISAKLGENIVTRSEKTPWYGGPSLLSCLEDAQIKDQIDRGSFRFPVQWVNRPNSEFRGYAGTIVAGSVRVGDKVVVACSERTSSVEKIVTFDGSLEVDYSY
jgi:bifunctional enzyme CysN/CysC